MAKSDHRVRARFHAVPYEDFDQNELFEEQGWICGICGLSVDKNATELRERASLDHIIPLSKGGSHSRDNCQLAHFRCNSKKGSSHGLAERAITYTLPEAAEVTGLSLITIRRAIQQNELPASRVLVDGKNRYLIHRSDIVGWMRKTRSHQIQKSGLTYDSAKLHADYQETISHFQRKIQLLEQTIELLKKINETKESRITLALEQSQMWHDLYIESSARFLKVVNSHADFLERRRFF